MGPHLCLASSRHYDTLNPSFAVCLCEALSSQCVRSLLLRSPCVSCARRDRQGLWKRTLAFFQLAVACEVPVVLLSVSEVPEDLGHVFRKMCLPSASILRHLDRGLLGDLVRVRSGVWPHGFLSTILMLSRFRLGGPPFQVSRFPRMRAMPWVLSFGDALRGLLL